MGDETFLKLFFQYFIINISQHCAKLKEFSSEYSYIIIEIYH